MSESRYTVRQLGWYQPPHGDPYTRRVPTAVPVAGFDTFDAAEEHRRELEAGARAGENPFRFGGCSVFFQSSLDGMRLHDWLMDEGIDPPASELRHGDWHEWWAAFAHTWTEGQLHHAWSAFDKVRFFDVVEEPQSVAHAVVEIVWGLLERDWNAMTAGTEGGRLMGVYRRAARAERFRAELSRDRNAGGGRYRYDRRAGYSADPHNPIPARQATFYEALAVPSDVPPFAGVGYLVQRRAVIDTFAGTVWRTRPPADARVPVALYAARSDAVEHRDRLAAESRQVLNPFVFADPAHGAATEGAREELAALELPLPVPSGDRRRDWIEWWDLCQEDVSDEQRAAVWRACDQPMFEVLRVEVADE
ncbi:hypothetical protein R5W24_004658 [Gemmata sp. JC717]|uniref:hypothetical protein n=1 Tax=Gemmata algarum TaxID=2975278 RepID=UPI0021BB89D2|nr:hypothetical protein [Gemmata algarum]MDY3555515.1 hypothetical protein [Gemmata algarum]